MVTALHFKSYELEENITSIEDLKVIKLKRNISNMMETFDQDKQFGCTNQSSSKEDSEVEAKTYQHATLKSSCPARWNCIGNDGVYHRFVSAYTEYLETYGTCRFMLKGC